MAVDSAQKRYSMINFGTDDNQMLFEVDGSVDIDDRGHLLGCYSGVGFSPAPPAPVQSKSIMFNTSAMI